MKEALSNFPEFVLFGSMTLFYITTLIFIFLLFVSEVTENGWLALISFGVFVFITTFQGNLEPLDHLANIQLVSYYIGIGLIHSLIRTYLYGRKRKPMRLEAIEAQNEWNEKYRKDGEEPSTSKIEKFDSTTYDKLKGNVFRWWFLWPISLLTWIFSDLLRDFWNLLYDNTKKIFQAIVDAGMK